MTVRRLVNIIEALTVSQDPQGIRSDQLVQVLSNEGGTVFMEQGTVVSIVQNNVTVTVKGSPTSATMATDEPLQVGDRVWVSQTEGRGFIVLGSVK